CVTGRRGQSRGVECVDFSTRSGLSTISVKFPGDRPCDQWARDMELPDTIYHYCPPDAFLNILETGTLRLTHISYFEDQDELRWYENLVCDRIAKRDPEGKSERLQNVRTMLNYSESTALFCVSFSEEPDMLSQWKA